MKNFRFIKRILEIGRFSRAIVIPKIMLDSLGWRAKQKVEIIPDFKNNRVIIKDFKK